MKNSLLEKLKSGEYLIVRLRHKKTYIFGENNNCIININANQMWSACLDGDSVVLSKDMVNMKIPREWFLSDWIEWDRRF